MTERAYFGELFDLGARQHSTRTADVYAATHKRDRSRVHLWLLRHPLAPGSSAVERFLQRIQGLKSITPSIADIRSAGVDPSGMAYASIVASSGNVLSELKGEKPDQILRWFRACVAVVASLHRSDIVCGDLCGASFWVYPQGTVRFYGVMGSFDVEATATAMAPPEKSAPFLAPEQRGVGTIVAATDVYALGVLGYFLLTSKFPYGEGLASMVIDPDATETARVSSARPEVPAWFDEVFVACTRSNASDRYTNAGELLQALDGHLQRTEGGGSDHRVFVQDRSATGASSAAYSEDQLHSEPNGLSTSTWILIALVLIAIGAGIGFVAYSFMSPSGNGSIASEGSPGKGSLPEEVGGAPAAPSLQGTLGELVDRLSSTDSFQARSMLQGAVLSRLRESGYDHTARVLDSWRKGRLVRTEDGAQVMLRAFQVVDPERGFEKRRKLLQQLYPSHPRSAVRLAAAYAFDANAFHEYSPVIAQLVSKAMQLDSDSISALALLIHDEGLRSEFGGPIWKRADELSDEDVRWLLHELGSGAEGEDYEKLLNIAAKRGVLGERARHFIALREKASEIPPDAEAAFRAAIAGKVSIDHLQALARWFDASAEEYLLTICASTNDATLRREAFEILLGRGLLTEPARALAQWVREYDIEERLKFAKIFCALSMPGVVEDDVFATELRVLDEYVREPQLKQALLEIENEALVTYIARHHLGVLGREERLNMLQHPDPLIRRNVVRSLRGTSGVENLREIVKHYKAEKDPKVQEAYRESFWFIRQRTK